MGCGGERANLGSQPQSGRAIVANVSDGDTVRLTDGRRVRLVQIDAPELETDCYGRAARRALIGIAPPGSGVVLERDPALDDVDRYGRALRYVLVDGRNVNIALVTAGAAVPYFFRNERGRLAQALLAAVRAAWTHRRGLWGACPHARLAPALGAVTGAP